MIDNHSHTFVAPGGLWILGAIRSLGISHKCTGGFTESRKYDIKLEVHPQAIDRQVSSLKLYCNKKYFIFTKRHSGRTATT